MITFSTARLKLKLKTWVNWQMTVEMKRILLFCCINCLYEPEMSQGMADLFIIMGITFVKHIPIVHLIYTIFIIWSTETWL